MKIAIPELRQTQYSTSDGKGVYSFGYAFPEQMHTESRSSDGVVSGSYFYRDPEGNLNKVTCSLNTLKRDLFLRVSVHSSLIQLHLTFNAST